MLLSEIDIARRLVDPDEKKRLIITPIVNAREQFGPSSFERPSEHGFPSA